MKTNLRTLLTSNVDPFFFALACFLLVSVLFTAKLMIEDVEKSTTTSYVHDIIDDN